MNNIRRYKVIGTLNAVNGKTYEDGTVLYECMKYDYGLSSEDTYRSGYVHFSLTEDENGDYPFFTVPEHRVKLVKGNDDDKKPKKSTKSA